MTLAVVAPCSFECETPVFGHWHLRGKKIHENLRLAWGPPIVHGGPMQLHMSPMPWAGPGSQSKSALMSWRYLTFSVFSVFFFYGGMIVHYIS